MKRNLLISILSLSLVIILYLIFTNLSQVGMAGRLPKKVDYNFHVQPILSDKCYACHGPDENARKANLRLDIRDNALAILKDSDNLYAIIPGDPENSQLIHRIFSDDSTTVMPPPESKLFLSDSEKDLLKRWIVQGAEYKPHWSFLPPQTPDIPEIDNPSWASNEIDYFILSKLENIGLKPNNTAGREALLKRVSFDLTGLPPSVKLQDQFLSDKSDNAYEKVVDQLLSSIHYGEKMAIHWLDVARYADSHGYQDDGFRTMWPWRDWVIHAFNNNYPYDKFVTMQLAGDLLPQASVESILATGFNRNHKITQEGGVIDEEYRIEYVTDRTNTFGKAFLGLTFECAKCHDHKYDPISTKEYYSTFAFFNQVPEKGLFGTIDASFADPPNMMLTSEIVQEEVPFVNLKDSLGVAVMVMKDSPRIRNTHILNRGAYDQPGEIVNYSTPQAVLPFDSVQFEQNRLGLASWLLDDSNPLTARVFVNRIWNQLFGRGLVNTVGDFGVQGEIPSHPELLDWLAIDFQNNQWDIKRLIKNILMSSTYRQSAEVREEQLSLDPENTYLSRSNRSRFSAEIIRDHILKSSGLLVSEVGGPSVKPYQPEGLWQSATSGRGTLQKYIADEGDNLYRRGLYTFIKRTVPPPSMLMFDASNRDQCEVDRLNTQTPLQALIMLNDPQVLEASRVFAESLLQNSSSSWEKIHYAFRSIICRTPSDEELEVLLDYHNESVVEFGKDSSRAIEFTDVGQYPSSEYDPVKVAALMQVIHTIYNMEEAITKS